MLSCTNDGAGAGAGAGVSDVPAWVRLARKATTGPVA